MYLRNRIEQVIFKIDFDVTIGIEPIFNNEFLEKVLLFYKTKEIDEIEYEVEIALDNTISEFKGQKNQLISSRYSSLDKFNSIKFNKKYVVFILKSFKNGIEFQNCFEPILSAFMKNNQNISISRIGYRFINHFEEKKFTSADFNKALKTAIKDSHTGGNLLLSRSITREEYISDDIRITVNSGLYNPTYPSALNIRDILLDIDAVHNGNINKLSDVIEISNRSYASIKDIFESYITPSMRRKLNNANN